jgi:FtsP/CotA-like multicopper oxidase with cupredoxin domain
MLLRAGAALVGSVALGGCTAADPALPPQTVIGPADARVAAAESARRSAGVRVVAAALVPAPAAVDLGGVVVSTWAYNGAVPGPELRVRAGDVLRVAVSNGLPEDTTVHWHGLALRNDMDGVPDLTQPPIAAGSAFTYEFVAPHPGTYWFHPHVGTQLDRGLYAPLIVEDPAEPGEYDFEQTIMLDDWLDGTGRTPLQVLDSLRGGAMDMPGMGGTAAGNTRKDDSYPQSLLGGDPGDVSYPYFLLNGRLPARPLTIDAKPGQRMRLRVVNAASDTVFRFAVAGHRMTMTHSDGFPVRPVDTDAVLISMGERYDAVVTLADGVFPLVAVAEGKTGHCRAIIRTAKGADPAVDVLPSELTSEVLGEADLTAADDVLVPERAPDRSQNLILGGGMMPYRWEINGRAYGQHTPLLTSPGEYVRLRFVNTSKMFHPMHVHGHTFQVRHALGPGARKDTVMVMPGQTVIADMIADNPGQWLAHCHNLYHAEAGMMTVLSYLS